MYFREVEGGGLHHIMSNKKLISFTNFNKGVNSTKSFDELDSSELISAINVDLKARGGYSKRKGAKIHKRVSSGETTVPISRLIDYPNSPLVVLNKNLKKWDNDSITLLLSSNNIDYEFFTNSKLYLVDGTKYWVYNGTTCTEVIPTEGVTGNDLTPIKRCTRLLQRGQRLFALGDPQNPNYLYFSELGDPAAFKTTSVVKAVTDDNDSLVGMALFSEALLVFKRNSIFKWSGYDPATDVTFTPLDTGHGTVSPDTIQMTDDYLLFADNDGVYALNTVERDLIKVFNVSSAIKESYIKLANKQNMKAIVYQGNYYLSCCDGTVSYNNVVLKASLGMAYNGSVDEGISNLLFPWVEYRGWNVSDWIVIDDKLYFSSSVDGTIYEAFGSMNDQTYNTDTSEIEDVAINSTVSHYLKLEDAVTQKKVKRVFIMALQDKNYTSTIDLDIEAGYNRYHKKISLNLAESGAWDTRNWDSALWDWVDIVIKEITIGKKISRLKVTINHKEKDEIMTIYGFSAFYKVKKPRGSKDGISDLPLL